MDACTCTPNVIQPARVDHDRNQKSPALYKSQIEQRNSRFHHDSQYRKEDENNADSLYSKTFMKPVISDDPGIHGDFAGSFTIFGPNSLKEQSPFFVFQPATESSVPEPVSTTFKGKMKICPDKGIDVTFNIPANSIIPSLASNSQSLNKEPCEVTLQVHLPRNSVSPAVSNDKPDPNHEEEAAEYIVNPEILVSAPSNPPSPPPSSPRHQPLALVLSDNAALRIFVEQHILPNERVREVAFGMFQEPWLMSNEKEPSLCAEDYVVRVGLLPAGDYFSRFELFFDRNAKHRCQWMEGNERCAHEASRKNRAIGHAHSHFNYKPYACEGACGNAGCQQRFTCSTVLADHVGKRGRMRVCDVCQRAVTAQNLKRHMKLHT